MQMSEGRSTPLASLVVVFRLATPKLIVCALNTLLVAIAGWTLAYHLVLWQRWPAGVLALLFPATSLMLAGVWVALWGRENARINHSSQSCGPSEAISRDPMVAWGIVLAVGLAICVCTLLVNRPDSDDIAYYRRAAVQAAAPGKPIIVHNLTYDLPVQDIVPTQYLVSYELLAAFVGRWTGADGLGVYHNWFPAVAAMCCPLVYYLLCRILGLDLRPAMAGALGATLFLLLDGNRHWSPGNFAFVRLWQGKCLLITLGLPGVLLLAFRFLKRPTAARWFGLLLAGIAGLGLSATAAFLVPGLLAVVAAAYVFAGDDEQTCLGRSARAALLLASGIYPVIVTGVFRLAHPELAQQIAALPAPASWWVVAAQFGDARAFVAYGCLLLISPWLILPRPRAAMICLMTIANLFCFFNPVSGGLLLRILGNVYFRTFYIFPLPLCAGLAGAAMAAWVADLRTPWGQPHRGLWRPACAAALWGMFVVQCRPTVAPSNHGGPGPENALELKSPLEYRFPSRVRNFLSAAGGRLDGRRVLAPWEVAIAVGVANPRARLLISRECYSRWSFVVGGMPERFETRRLAQQMVSAKAPPPKAEAALRQLVGEGLDAVVVGPKADLATVRAALRSGGAQWNEATSEENYRLFLRRSLSTAGQRNASTTRCQGARFSGTTR